MSSSLSRRDTARSICGLLRHDDGTINPARFYFGDDEPVPRNHERISAADHATWVEDAITPATASSIVFGATKRYAAKYVEIDWGN